MTTMIDLPTSDDFRRGIALIEQGTALLGPQQMQTVMLKVCVAAVKGGQPFLESAQAALDVLYRLADEPPAPAPEPRERYPEPADFDPKPLIGHVAGEPVYGSQDWDTVAGVATRCSASVTLCGLTIHAYPDDPHDPNSVGDSFNFGVDALSCCPGDVSRADVGRLKELLTMPGEPLIDLLELARRWCSEELAAS